MMASFKPLVLNRRFERNTGSAVLSLKFKTLHCGTTNKELDYAMLMSAERATFQEHFKAVEQTVQPEQDCIRYT